LAELSGRLTCKISIYKKRPHLAAANQPAGHCASPPGCRLAGCWRALAWLLDLALSR